MARGRMLSRTLGSSRRFNALTEVADDLGEFAQLLFTMMIPHADDFGRMAGDAFSVKMSVIPGNSRTFPEVWAALKALHHVKLITVYPGVDSDIWLQINKFEEHQSGLHKRTVSKIPSPPEDESRKFPEIPGGSAPTELNRTELKGTKEREIKLTREARPAETSLSPVLKPQNGNGNGHRPDPLVDEITTERAARFIERYEALYPEHRKGARYAVRPARDYVAAVTLCETWTDDTRLDKLAVCFLTTDHKFAEEGSRTIPQFLAMASWCDGKLAEWEAKRA